MTGLEGLCAVRCGVKNLQAPHHLIRVLRGPGIIDRGLHPLANGRHAFGMVWRITICSIAALRPVPHFSHASRTGLYGTCGSKRSCAIGSFQPAPPPLRAVPAPNPKLCRGDTVGGKAPMEARALLPSPPGAPAGLAKAFHPLSAAPALCRGLLGGRYLPASDAFVRQ